MPDDIVERIETELDRLDPQPGQQRHPRRRIGKVEAGVRSDLRRLPKALAGGGIAQEALQLAILLDAGAMTPRDHAAVAAQLRMSLSQLADMAPGEVKGDATDEVRARRERNLARADDGEAGQALRLT
jgi:hypothetical protein